MKLPGWKSDDIDALARFYEAGAAWSWLGISEKNGTDTEREIARWIEALATPRDNPILLPIVKPGTNCATWFALAFSARQSEELRELLQAFIGQAGSNFTGHRPGGQPAGDAISVAVREWCGGDFFFEFQPLENSVAEIRAALNRLNRLLLKRPPRSRIRLRTTEALLAEYRAALRDGDESAAEKWIAELTENGRLSAQNLLFLRYDCHVHFGRWQEMTTDPQWHRALHLRRPRRVTLGMIRALWHQFFANLIDEPTVVVVEKMRSVLLEYRPLFKSALGSRDPEVLAMFALVCAADDPPRHVQLAKTLAAFPESDSDSRLRDFAKSVAELIAPPSEPEVDPLEAARDAIAHFDPETAWEILTGELDSDAKNSVTWIFLLLQSARDIESAEAAQFVADELEKRGGAEAVLRTGTQRDQWARLQEIAASAHRHDGGP